MDQEASGAMTRCCRSGPRRHCRLPAASPSSSSLLCDAVLAVLPSSTVNCDRISITPGTVVANLSKIPKRF